MLQPEQFFGRHLPLTQEDILAAAKFLGIAPGTVAAVIEVEAGGDPFISDGRPKILYEAHKFGSFTKYVHNQRFDTKGKPLSSKAWNKTYYGPSGAWQYKRLEMAMNLNNQQALRATSWGAFQIMGFNFQTCGFNNVDDFVLACCDSAGKQTMAFCNFIKNNGLADELRRKDWDDFARGYNGPKYKDNKYDTKLAAADIRLVSSWAKRYIERLDPTGAQEISLAASDISDGSAEYDLTRADVAALQAALNASRLLVKPIKADGWYGPNTAAALRVFQATNKVGQSGMFDPDTLELLHYTPTKAAA